MAYAPFDLTGKAVLITGGNRGIGLGFAEALTQAGAKVAIWGSHAGRNAEAEGQVGGGAKAWTVNVADERAVATAMSDVVRHFGRVDTVIANAGVMGDPQTFAEASSDSWRRVMDVNLHGVFYTLREAAKHMIARAKAGDEGGSLVAVASIAAIEGSPRHQAYAATKGAVISMIKGIAVEHARYGIRANAILPGWIATDMTNAAQGSDVFNDKVIKRVPMRRWGKAKDFGGIAVYLSSDASAFHTGDAIVIDGGYTVF